MRISVTQSPLILSLLAFVSWGDIVTAQPSPLALLCPGDCDVDGAVTVDEIVRAADIFVGTLPLAVCPAADTNDDTFVRIGDIFIAVTTAGDACPPAATVPPPPTADTVSVTVGALTAAAGSRVDVPVSLSTGGHDVVAVQNFVGFDATLPIAARADGTPDCTINPAIGIESAVSKSAFFTFQPPECVGTTCKAVLAFVIGLPSVTAIPDGAVLYTCSVDVPADAAAGDHALRARGISASDPGANILVSGGSDGTVTVRACTSLPTPELSVSLALDPPNPRVGDVVDLVFTAFGSGGSPTFSLSVNDPILTELSGPLEPSPAFGTVTYRARATLAGTTTATLSAMYEAAFGCAEAPVYSFITQSSPPISITVLPPLPTCVGDCTREHDVRPADLIAMLRTALAGAPPTDCAAGDANLDETIRIDEILLAVNNAFGGCP